MSLFFVVLCNVVIAWAGIESMGFEAWFKVTCILLQCLAIGIPFEALVIARLIRFGSGIPRNVFDLFRRLRQQFRERSSKPGSSCTSDTP